MSSKLRITILKGTLEKAAKTKGKCLSVEV